MADPNEALVFSILLPLTESNQMYDLWLYAYKWRRKAVVTSSIHTFGSMMNDICMMHVPLHKLHNATTKHISMLRQMIIQSDFAYEIRIVEVTGLLYPMYFVAQCTLHIYALQHVLHICTPPSSRPQCHWSACWISKYRQDYIRIHRAWDVCSDASSRIFIYT